LPSAGRGRRNAPKQQCSCVLCPEPLQAVSGVCAPERFDIVANREHSAERTVIRAHRATADASPRVFACNAYTGGSGATITGGYFRNNSVAGTSNADAPTPTHDFRVGLDGLCDVRSVIPHRAPSLPHTAALFDARWRRLLAKRA
jgi:hypothetical protein